MQERRGRVLRRLALMVSITAIIIVMAMLQRDNQSARWQFAQVERIAERIRASLNRSGAAPDVLTLQQIDRDLAEHYYFNTAYAQQAAERGESGVCCSRSPVRMFLRSDRRFVLLYDGKNFQVRGVPEAEFQRNAERWGLMLARVKRS